MKRQEAEKLIGSRVQAWTSANGVYVGKLIQVIASRPWRGVVEVDGVISPAHHFEFGQTKRRGFRPGEPIEVGGVNINPTEATGVTYLEALEADNNRLNELLVGCTNSNHLWALKGTIKANERIIEAEQNRLQTGEWKIKIIPPTACPKCGCYNCDGGPLCDNN